MGDRAEKQLSVVILPNPAELSLKVPWAHLPLENLGLARLLWLSQYCICLDLRGCILKMFRGFSTESVRNTTRNHEKSAVTKHQGSWNWGNRFFLRVTGQVNYEQVFAVVVLWKLPLCHSCSGQTVISRLAYSSQEKFLLCPPFFNYTNTESRRHFEQAPEAPGTVLIQLLFALHPTRSRDE